MPANLTMSDLNVELSFEVKACIEACTACAVACNYCAGCCLQEEDAGMMAKCIALDVDCAQSCAMAAALMTRSSPFADKFCTLCAEICTACGDECAQHDMDHCQRCAAACRACAEACRSMGA